MATLAEPDEIRRSVQDPGCVLFYRRFGRRWLTVVASRTDGTAFLVTAYPSDKVKQGELLWRR